MCIFSRNALDYLSPKTDDDCLKELRWLYEHRSLQEAQLDLGSWLSRWESKYPKLCDWVEDNIQETWTFYSLPATHHKHLKSTNLLKRLNQEIKRWTHVVRIFPKSASCLRLVCSLAIERHQEWLEGYRYLNMDWLKENKKAALHAITEAA